VPPRDYETIKSIVEQELGQPINKIFKHFDKEAIAAASIG
jgi:ubiquinone biosynthesis protein